MQHLRQPTQFNNRKILKYPINIAEDINQLEKAAATCSSCPRWRSPTHLSLEKTLQPGYLETILERPLHLWAFPGRLPGGGPAAGYRQPQQAVSWP